MDWEADAIGSGGVVLRNVNTYLNMGIEGRVGYNLPQDFGTTHIRPGGEANIPFLDERYNGLRISGILAFCCSPQWRVGRSIRIFSWMEIRLRTATL